MIFRIRNAGNTFQRLIDRMLSGVDQASPYLYDILVFSRGDENHRCNLAETFSNLRAANLTANAEKCKFRKSSIEFLGHTVSAAGISPLPDWVTTIATNPRPRTVKDVQNFFGVINFYRKFMRGAAALLKPLSDLLQGSPRPKAVVQWAPEKTAAFKAAKAALQKATNLVYPQQGTEMALMVDASAVHVRAVLQQRTTMVAAWQPLVFFSNKINGEKNTNRFHPSQLL
jgi:hypothetical protein